MKLSIIVPVYNEQPTLPKIIGLLESLVLPWEKEIILVDDGSTDGSRELLLGYQDKYQVILRPNNEGKGAAIHSGLAVASGDYVVIQDADLEYDPQDWLKLINEVELRQELAVYGSRNLQPNPRSSNFYYYGGRLITGLINVLFGARLSDVNTCYKMVKRELLLSLDLRQPRFDFCEETTIKLLLKGVKIKEVPISYIPRQAAAGKKISLRDGLRSIKLILRLRLFGRQENKTL